MVLGKFCGFQRRPISMTADAVPFFRQAVGADTSAESGANYDEIKVDSEFSMLSNVSGRFWPPSLAKKARTIQMPAGLFWAIWPVAWRLARSSALRVPTLWG